MSLSSLTGAHPAVRYVSGGPRDGEESGQEAVVGQSIFSIFRVRPPYALIQSRMIETSKPMQ
jgi:hypothetical protein